MNRALLYLWVSLLKRRILCACKGLRRPANLLGFLAVAFCFGALFYYRREKWYAELVRPASLWGAAMIMLAGSFFKGFLQRGLAFELPDIEFLFTSPFTQRQIIFYRLLPNYLYAVLQAIAFLLIFASHLHHPFITWVCVVLFQVVCFHIATAAAIYSGTIREELHHRIRWMLLGFYFVVSVLYLRVAWDIKLIPKVLAGPLVDAAFYPALTLSNVTNLPFLQNWAELLKIRDSATWRTLWEPAAYLAAFIFAAGISFVMLMGSRRNIFETSITTSARVVERKRRLQEGQPI